MGRLVYTSIGSLDGYVADRNGNRVGVYRIAGSGAGTTLTAWALPQ